MFKHGEKEIRNNCYKFDAGLKCYLDETLDLMKLTKKRTMAGETLTVRERKRIATNRVHKTRTLNNIIFPAMANLTFFFEQVSKHPELQESLDDDIQELLLGSKDDGPVIFRRLLDGILMWNPKQISKKDQQHYQDLNFRAELFYTMLLITLLRVPSILKTQIPIQVINPIASQDLGRALAWTEILRSRSPDFDNSASLRKVLF